MLLSGAALGFSFPPFPGYGLAWIALAPILLRWMRAESGRPFYFEALGMWLVASLISFSWPLLHPSTITALASLGGVLALCMIGALPFGLSIPVRRRLGLVPGLIGLMALALAVEWALQTGPLAFPWMLYGHTQAKAAPFNQLAALGGSALLSGWVLLLNAALLLATMKRYRIYALMVLILAVSGAAGYGLHRLDDAPGATGSTTALLVQPGLPATSWADVHDPHRVRHLQQLTNDALTERPTDESAPLVIWPETALPPAWSPDGDSVSVLQSWVKRKDIQLLTGSIRPAPSAERGLFYNSAILFRPGEPPQVYNKNRLVPFAERVPLIELIPALQAFAVPAGGVAGYEMGRRQPQMHGAEFQAGVLICFESTFSGFARQYARAPGSADFLVTLAQDGWWGQSLGYRQHFAFTRLRAIETGRAVAMVTVTGVTGLIDADGRASTQTNWMDQTARWVQIPHHTAQTPSVRWGPWVEVGALTLALVLTLLTLLRARGAAFLR